MKVAITGGGGYLGTVLVRHLLATTPHRIQILDRFDWGVQPIGAVLTPGTAPRVTLLTGDIRDRRRVSHALKGCDQIVHLAGIVGYPACDADPQDADTTNVQGTQEVITAAEGRPIVFASTGSCYGQVEGEATESTPLSPLTRYGRNKAEAERRVIDAGGIALRLATLFGLSPRMRWDLLPNDFCRRGVAGEIQLYEAGARRTFLHVEDAARAFWWALEGRLGPGVWNVGDASMNWNKRMLASAIHALTGCTITAADGHDPDGRDYAVDYRKLAAMHFEPAYLLRESLPAVVAAARVWK